MVGGSGTNVGKEMKMKVYKLQTDINEFEFDASKREKALRLKLERELEGRKMELAEALDEEQRDLEFQRSDLAQVEEKRHNLSRHLENAIESFEREQADKDNLID